MSWTLVLIYEKLGGLWTPGWKVIGIDWNRTPAGLAKHIVSCFPLRDRKPAEDNRDLASLFSNVKQ